MRPSRLRLVGTVSVTLCLAATAAITVRALGDFGSAALERTFTSYGFVVVLLLGSVAPAIRAHTDRENRALWALVSAAGVTWAAGNVAYFWMARGGAAVPIPSVADAGFLAWPILLGGGLAVFARRSFQFARGARLDALLGGALVATLSMALVIEPVIAAADRQNALAFAVNLAYPLGDVLIVALVVVILIRRGWHLPRSIGLLALSVVGIGVADSFYLVGISAGTYTAGGAVDVLYLVAWSLTAVGALATDREPKPRTGLTVGERVLPVAMALAALGLMVLETFGDASPLTVAACVLTLTIALGRMGVVLADNRTLLQASQVEALTDALTGLRNRRSLIADLARWGGGRVAVTIFDLDGFKLYNDTYGHGAGDELLRRIADRLTDAVSGHGHAYRMGGDEFAVVADTSTRPAEMAAALTETGDGFMIGASYGTAILPDDASDVQAALHLADARMYARKFGRRGIANQDSADVLIAVLEEQSGSLATHGRTVAELAAATARRLRLSDDEVDVIALAAQLHDVGKLAMPAAIINKPGELDEAEWAFMRRHTLVGERILRAASSLATVAEIVRASHERWDGGGYPDRVAGEEIPLAARIIFVCDAFDAMTTLRPYREPLSVSAAFAELTRCAGTQFDPAVVVAFGAVLEHRPSREEPAVLAIANSGDLL
jgi:diguanylate cyclase (GGDEF)-like protein